MRPGIDSTRVDQTIKPSLRHYAVIFALTLFYFLILFYQSKNVRLALVAGSIFTILLIMKPKMSFWFSVFPLAIIFGGAGMELGEFSPNYVTLCAFALFAGYAFRRAFWKDPPIPVTKAGRFVFAALLLQVASVLISLHVHEQYTINVIREGFGIFIMIPLMFIVPDLFRGEEGVVRVTKILLLMLLLTGVIGMLQRASATGFSRVDLTLGYFVAGRFTATFGGPNIFAGFLELTVPMSLACALIIRSKLWRTVAFMAFGFGILCVLYTFSRGGFITCILASSFIIIVRFRKKLIISFVILLLFAMILLANKDTFHRQINLISNPASAILEPTLLHRYITYQRYWYEFMQRPLIGSGWGAREYFWGRTQLYAFWEVRHTRSIRSIPGFGGLNSLFFNTAVKGGAVSLAALFLLLAAVYTASVSALRSRRGMLTLGFVVSMGAFLLHQLIDNLLQWQQISAVFWINVGVLVSIGLLKRDTEAKPFEARF